MKICGIYCIQNTINKKRYIGQSINVKNRLAGHKHYLKKGTHINKHLQRSFNKYGLENFTFKLLKECKKDELDALEIELINRYDTTNQDYGYNHEYGGTKTKKATIESKIKRRGKWSHGISSKTSPAYQFRNMGVELWNTLRNYIKRDYTTKEVKLPETDINKNKPFEEFSTVINVEKEEETESMVDYNKLINKYYRKDGKNITGVPFVNPAERFSSEYKQKLRKEERRKHRHLLLDELVTECPFHITKIQITQIRYWIDSFSDDFKNFHRRSSNETIILAMIFIQRKQADKKTQVEDYAISKKYKLTESVFITIQNKLIFKLMNTVQLKYSQSKYANHEELIKKQK